MMRPIPAPTPASQAFFSELDKRRLVVQRCAACSACQLGEHRCNRCRSRELVWIPATGRASLYSFVIVYIPYHPAFAAQVPYNVATVELEEGPRLFSNIIGCTPADLRIGLPLRVRFEQYADSWLPAFEPG